MVKHLNIKIYGRVQMVGFRYSTKDEAEKAHVLGFTQNLSDGSVYVEAEGEESNLQKFLQWCQKGPFLAKVDQIQVEEDRLKNFPDFKVL